MINIKFLYQLFITFNNGKSLHFRPVSSEEEFLEATTAMC